MEPLYLQAENSQLPELKRVVVAFGNSIVMEPSLEQALVRLFGEQAQQPETPGVPGEPPPATEDTVPGLRRRPGNSTIRRKKAADRGLGRIWGELEPAQ